MHTFALVEIDHYHILSHEYDDFQNSKGSVLSCMSSYEAQNSAKITHPLLFSIALRVLLRPILGTFCDCRLSGLSVEI